MSQVTDATGLVASVIDVVDELITSPDRDTIIAGLNAEIDLVQSRFTVLSAIRDSLISEVEEEAAAELPLETTETRPQLGEASLESQIVEYIGKHGPTTSKDIAAALGVHYVTVGYAVKRSNSLAKDGKHIIVKLS